MLYEDEDCYTSSIDDWLLVDRAEAVDSRDTTAQQCVLEAVPDNTTDDRAATQTYKTVLMHSVTAG